MAATPESGFLVIADLTGYTAYLAQGELEHAPTIAGDLLETIVGRLEPPFRLAKFEGDAAFLFVEDGRADGSLLLDAIEASYLAFQRRLRSIDLATTCDCNACRLAPKLDLKVFIHHGAYVRTRIAGRVELAGSDVIVVHRLLKGSAIAAERPGGFALLTAPAIAALGLDAGALDVGVTAEVIEHLGALQTAAIDLEARWTAASAERRLLPPERGPDVELTSTIDAEPAVVWGLLTSPAGRAGWEGPIAIDDIGPGGRRGVGTRATCVTGRLRTLEEVVDWQPYEHVGWRRTVPGVGPTFVAADLTPDGGATRLRWWWARDGEAAEAADADGVRAAQEAALGRLAQVASSRPMDP